MSVTCFVFVGRPVRVFLPLNSATARHCDAPWLSAPEQEHPNQHTSHESSTPSLPQHHKEHDSTARHLRTPRSPLGIRIWCRATRGVPERSGASMRLTDTCPSGAPHRALAGWDLGPVILASPRRDLSMHAPWLARALCVGRLGLLYTLERTKLCAPENIACHIARSHRPLPSLAHARRGSLCAPTRAARAPG